MKFLMILVIVLGIVILFNMAGVDTASGLFMKGFLSSGFGYFTSSEFWNLSCSSLSQCASSIPLILTVGLGAGAIASLFGRSPDISYIIGGLALALMTILVLEMGGIWLQLSEVMGGWALKVVSLLMFLLTIGMVYSGISWFRGADG